MRYVWDGSDWVLPSQRKPRLQIVSDESKPFKSHADGKVYTSKARYRAELKARGFIEVGNEYDGYGSKPEPTTAIPDLERAFSRLS